SLRRGGCLRFAGALGAGDGGFARTRGGVAECDVSEVARRHEISSQHLFAWHKAARPAGAAGGRGGRVCAGHDGSEKPVATTPSITIETAGIVVRAECAWMPGGSRLCCAW